MMQKKSKFCQMASMPMHLIEHVKSLKQTRLKIKVLETIARKGTIKKEFNETFHKIIESQI